MANKWTVANLTSQFNHIIKLDVHGQVWYNGFLRSAKDYALPIGILLGVASRETNIQNIIGDSGHGYGIMQIDVRYHQSFVSSGVWKNPNASIAKGAQVLSDFRSQITRFNGKKYKGLVIPRITGQDLTRCSVACYNAGFDAVVQFVEHGNPDLATTGKDYSKDVLERAEVFESLIDQLNNKGAGNVSTKSDRDGP